MSTCQTVRSLYPQVDLAAKFYSMVTRPQLEDHEVWGATVRTTLSNDNGGSLSVQCIALSVDFFTLSWNGALYGIT